MGILSRFMGMNQHSHDDLVREQKFFEFIGSFVCQASHFEVDALKSGEESGICLLAHSPQSPVARALKSHGETLLRQGVQVQVIFADVSDAQGVQEFCASFATKEAMETGKGQLSIRSIGQKSLLDAHEQMILGNSKCWSGDTLRRGGVKSNLKEIFTEDNLEDIYLARMAFDGMWAATDILSITWKQIAGMPGQVSSSEESVEDALLKTNIQARTSAEYATRH